MRFWLFSFLFVGLLSACGTRIDAIKETVNLAVNGPRDIKLTSEQVSELKYPSIYFKFKSGKYSLLTLAFDDKGQFQWVSGAGESVTTVSGRAARTEGLKINLLGFDNLVADPLNCIRSEDYSAVDVSELCHLEWSSNLFISTKAGRHQISIKGAFEYKGTQQVKLRNHQDIKGEYWVEKVTTDEGQSFKNHYILSAETKRVVQTKQTYTKLLEPMQIEIVKAYSKDKVSSGVAQR